MVRIFTDNSINSILHCTVLKYKFIKKEHFTTVSMGKNTTHWVNVKVPS